MTASIYLICFRAVKVDADSIKLLSNAFAAVWRRCYCYCFVLHTKRFFPRIYIIVPNDNSSLIVCIYRVRTCDTVREVSCKFCGHKSRVQSTEYYIHTPAACANYQMRTTAARFHFGRGVTQGSRYRSIIV